MTDSNANQAPDLQDLEYLKASYDKIREQIAKVIVGQDEVIEQLLVSIFARGHCILEGVPGLAKTLLVSTLAKSLSLDFTRIQFTPDLMPSDITGTEVIQENQTTGHREFKFVNGPVFTNVLLADEINRTPPKTQAALLEGMQERQVSAGGQRFPLPDPFFVLATQNPIEQEGTYPLPEAQLDRFFMKVFVNYPSPDEERRIYKMMTGAPVAEPEAQLSPEAVLKLQETVRRVPINDMLLDYVMRFIRATRHGEHDAPDFIKRWLLWGAGPRGGQALIMAAKTRAALRGRPEVSVEDLHAMAVPVLRHRIVVNYNAEAEGQTPDTVIQKLIETVSVGGASGASDPAVQRTLTAQAIRLLLVILLAEASRPGLFLPTPSALFMAQRSPFLDPELLARITPLGLKAARVVEGSITGLHRSPMHGVSPEFAEHREYTPGDDVKNLDWKVWAKSDRYVIKRYEEESNLRCTVMLDCSRSMQYAGSKAKQGRSKFEAAATLTACLTKLLMGQRDSVGLITIDTKPRHVLQPKATNRQLAQILDTLETTKPDGETDLGPVILRAADQLKRRGMVILISDFLCDLENLYEALGKLQHNGNEVIVLHVLDGEEIDLSFNDSIIFKDIEGSEEIFGEPWAFRKAYKQAMQDFVGQLQSRCQFAGMDHVLLRTDEGLAQKMAHYLHRRQRMAASTAGRGQMGGGR